MVTRSKIQQQEVQGHRRIKLRELGGSKENFLFSSYTLIPPPPPESWTIWGKEGTDDLLFEPFLWALLPAVTIYLDNPSLPNSVMSSHLQK